MAIGLENCPLELVENIVGHLDVADVGNLRLTSRCLRSKATQSHFKYHFRSKRVRVTSSTLRKLASVTQSGSLGCEIRHLTLVGVVNTAAGDAVILQERQRDYEHLRDTGEIVRLLNGAFTNIGTLHSLCLEVTVSHPDGIHESPPILLGNWRHTWQIAAETFRLVFAALQNSQLRLETLNVFNGAHMQRCSIASDELSGVEYRVAGVDKTLGSLKSLSISVSQRVIEATVQPEPPSDGSAGEIHWFDREERASDDIQAEAQDERNFTGLSELIHSCPHLTSLEIHEYQVNKGLPVEVPRERLFQRIAELGNLPPLEDCILRGVVLRETDLLAFVQLLSRSLRRLSLVTVAMHSGTFRSIFDCLVNDCSKIHSLYLDELTVGRNLVHFTGVGEPRFSTWVGAHGGNTLRREGDEVRKPVPYHLPSGAPQPMSSPERSRWLQAQRLEYGPPT
ncbi:hypothetical protein FE257_011107 [Aspergillus nanangensis]|uniref:F-box domain-containing protein n=1 Tax=Aspergillus nanangensis TaxID=2582783 RepID=A0AAD4CHS6_ASPNN|nr:hypothetical protein FE257_011107 [Aspergillus nanangensis]